MAFVVFSLAAGALALIALEAFIPGVSIAGFAGAALMAAGVYFCWSSWGMPAGLVLLVILCASAAIIFRTVVRSLKSGRLSKVGLIMNEETSPPINRRPAAPEEGSVGTAATALHPQGIGVFNGQRIHVTAGSTFIESGSRIRIVSTEGSRVLVKAEKD